MMWINVEALMVPPISKYKIDYAYVESNNFMHETHDKNDLCDSYIV
jgi:hypothetical protein